MIYKNLEEVFADFRYLTQESCFDYLLLSKPDSATIEEYFLQIKHFDDKFVFKFFKSLMKEFALNTSNWKTEITAHKLPVLVLIPNKGLRICAEITPDNLYKLEGASGIEYLVNLPSGSRVMEFSPIVDDNKKMTATQMFKDIAFKQRKYIIYAVIASFSINIFALVTSLYSMQVYDRVIPTGGVSTLISLSIGAIIAIFLELVLKISRSSILEHANKNMDMAYSHRIFDKFLKVRCDAMPKSIGLLSGQLQSYGAVRSFISSISIFALIDFPFALFFLVIIVIVGGYELGLVVFLFLIFSTLSGMMYKNKIDDLMKTSTMSSYKKLGLLVETVENAESVKSTYHGWKIQNKWNKLTNDNIEDDLKMKHFTDISSYVTAFIQQISYVVLVGIGAYIVSSTTTITMGSLIAVSILSGRVFSPFASIPSLFMAWGRAKMSIGMVGVNDERIIEASKQSGLISLINSLPKGLDTPIPDGSESVSSGQRQLIGLTRLIILNPEIWLLDEPTANIDEMSERMILKFFDTNLKDKTLIIISHKQSSFSVVNRLIVMNQNSIVLDGSKEEVIAKLSQANIKS